MGDWPATYVLRVQGAFDAHWADWFDGLRISVADDGTTTLADPLADQAALHGVLRKIRDLGLTLLSVERRDTPESGTATAERQRSASMTTATILEAIQATNARLMTAFRAGDAATVAACYTIDCLMLPPDNEPITGRAGVQTYWQGMLNLGVTAMTMETSELTEHGPSAVEIGHYTTAIGAGQVVDRGKYLVVWQRGDGAWQLSRDIWNSNLKPVRRIFAIAKGVVMARPRRRGVPVRVG